MEADAASARDSLEQRLRNAAEGDAIAISRLRKQYCFERFIRRLKETDAGETWCLKGGYAIQSRYRAPGRVTLDVDFATEERSLAEAELTLRKAATHDLGDHLVFHVAQSRETSEDQGDPTVRFSVVVEMAGREFERFPIDVGLAVGSSPEPEDVEIQTALPNEPRIDFPTIPIEEHAAEKIHAYTRTYGPTGESRSSRPRDLVDLALISADDRLDDDLLKATVHRVFARRATHELPARLEDPPDEWEEPFTNLATQVGLGMSLAEAFSFVANRIDPVLAK